MAEMSRRFNFDDFDKLCAEALEEDALMAEEGRRLEEEQAWAEHDSLFDPSDIGAVVLDLNANVVQLRPPDDAA